MDKFISKGISWEAIVVILGKNFVGVMLKARPLCKGAESDLRDRDLWVR